MAPIRIPAKGFLARVRRRQVLRAPAVRKKGVGRMRCPRRIIAYHVANRATVRQILQGGFKRGTDPKRCRIGKGVYFFGNKKRAIQYAKRDKGMVLTCILHTKRKMFDTGEKDYFQARWIAPPKYGIALGLHWPAMNSPKKFTELVKRSPKSVTVLKVGKQRAKLPRSSVFKKTQDKIFAKGFRVKRKRLKCGSSVDYI